MAAERRTNGADFYLHQIRLNFSINVPSCLERTVITRNPPTGPPPRGGGGGGRICRAVRPKPASTVMSIPPSCTNRGVSGVPAKVTKSWGGFGASGMGTVGGGGSGVLMSCGPHNAPLQSPAPHDARKVPETSIWLLEGGKILRVRRALRYSQWDSG